MTYRTPSTRIDKLDQIEAARTHLNRTIQLFHHGIVAMADVLQAKAEYLRLTEGGAA